MRTHQDDRGFRYCDIFPQIGAGDINITICYPQTLCAWHRHQKQTDFWFVAKGALKVGMWQEDATTPKFVYLSDRKPDVLEIKPTIWHGYYNFTNEEAILIYHITNKYDGTDEERMTADPEMWMKQAK